MPGSRAETLISIGTLVLRLWLQFSGPGALSARQLAHSLTSGAMLGCVVLTAGDRHTVDGWQGNMIAMRIGAHLSVLHRHHGARVMHAPRHR